MGFLPVKNNTRNTTNLLNPTNPDRQMALFWREGKKARNNDQEIGEGYKKAIIRFNENE